MLNQLEVFVKDYLQEYKDVEGALRLANRAGIIIFDTQVKDLLENSINAKERFK